MDKMGSTPYYFVPYYFWLTPICYFLSPIWGLWTVSGVLTDTFETFAMEPVIISLLTDIATIAILSIITCSHHPSMELAINTNCAAG